MVRVMSTVEAATTIAAIGVIAMAAILVGVFAMSRPSPTARRHPAVIVQCRGGGAVGWRLELQVR